MGYSVYFKSEVAEHGAKYCLSKDHHPNDPRAKEVRYSNEMRGLMIYATAIMKGGSIYEIKKNSPNYEAEKEPIWTEGIDEI